MTTHLGDVTGKLVLVDLYGLTDGAYLAVHEVLQLTYIMDLTSIKGFISCRRVMATVLSPLIHLRSKKLQLHFQYQNLMNDKLSNYEKYVDDVNITVS